MNNPMIRLCLIALFLIGANANLSAQNGVSAADKRAILEIFKGVDPSKYRLSFNGGGEVHGTKAIKMADLKQLSFIVGDRSENEVFYVYTEGESELVSVLGRQKVKALDEIARKYQDVGNR
jgi:hypothetical protein